MQCRTKDKDKEEKKKTQARTGGSASKHYLIEGKSEKRGQLLKPQKRNRQACRRLPISFIKAGEIQAGETGTKILKGRGNLTFYTHGQNTKEQIRLSQTRWSEKKFAEEEK